MTKKRSFDILLGLTFIGFLGLYIYNHFLIPKKTRIVTRPVITKANDLIKRKVTISESILNTTTTSSACTLFLKNSAELSMNDYANEFIDHMVDGIIKTCNGAFPTPLQRSMDITIKECKSSTRDKISKDCFTALLNTKIASAAAIIKPDINPNELDPTILMYLIADMFKTGDFIEHPERSMEIIEALLEKEPNYLAGYKLKLFLLSASSLSKEDNFKDLFHETFEEAKALNPNDPDLKEMELANKGNIFKKSENNDPQDLNNSKEFIAYLESESAKHPKEWIYDYYKANVVYNNGSGNYQEALILIENAIKKDPKNTRLKLTLENLKSEDENKRKHPFIITLGFSLDDL